MASACYSHAILRNNTYSAHSGMCSRELQITFLLSSIQAQGYTVVNNIIVCGNSSIYYIIYISLTIAFKLVIHVTGLILAFVTRKVKIDPLNDSRYSAALIYVSTLFLLASLVIFFLVEDNNIYAAVWTTYVLAEVCVFLGLNFIPKVSWP